MLACIRSAIPRGVTRCSSIPWRNCSSGLHSNQRPSERLARSPSHRLVPRACLSTGPLQTRAVVQTLPSAVSENLAVNFGNKRLLSVKGKDATKFLQGLTTNNVLDFGDGETKAVSYTAFLNASGRIEWDTMLYRYHDRSDDSWSWLIEVEPSRRESLWKHLLKHKLRSKVYVTKVDDISVSSATNRSSTVEASDLAFPDPRSPQLGLRLLETSGSNEEADSSPSALNQRQLQRYLLGIAEGFNEIVPGSALVQESNLDYLSGVDFKKGCYVGQELTIRTQHTGVVRKRIVPVQLYTGTAPEALKYDSEAIAPSALDDLRDARMADGPIDIMKSGSSSKRSAGRLLGNIGNIGLALCRLEMMTNLQISAEGGSFQNGDEFTLKSSMLGEDSGAKQIKVKAFVPAWLRDGIEADREKRRARGERAST